jgi:sirohydrochlorin cobaltochelatase
VDGVEAMMQTENKKKGVILFAHGSRDPLWRLPMDAVVQRMLEQQPDVAVSCAFLELTKPDLPQTVEALMKQGIEHLRIVPMFLGVGRHAREDLPLLVKDLVQAYPQMCFELMPPIGEHPAMTQLMADIAGGPSKQQ